MNESVVDFFSSLSEDFASAYQKDPDFRDRFELWTRVLSESAQGRKTAIDMGCGPGFFSFFLAGKGLEVIGVDAADGMIQLCRKKMEKEGIERCRFVKASLPDLPAGLPEADLILCSSVLEYVPDMEKALVAMSDRLKEGGLMILSLPNRQSLYRKWERLRFRLTGKPDYFRFVRNTADADSFSRLMEKLGFRCERIEFYAHANSISRVGRRFLAPRRTENLFLGVYRRAGK